MSAAAKKLTPEQERALAERMAEAQLQFKSTRAHVHEPLLLDDVCFMVDEQLRSEVATLAGEHIGDVLLDDTAAWFARKLKPDGETWGGWTFVRSAAEARAFIVSKIRQ